MPFESTLVENDRIIYLIFSDPLTLEELEQYFDNNFAGNSSPHKIHALVDIRKLVHPPPAGSIRAWRRSGLSRPNVGYTALIGGSGLVRLIANTIFWLAQYVRAKFFDTYEEGLTYLRDIIAHETEP
jgi:hypothetical protein